MSDIKTVDGSDFVKNDPLNSVKSEAVAKMRSALLACQLDDTNEARVAIQQVTLMRVHHQVARIIQYLDLMDRLEAKLYEAIDLNIATMDLFESSAISSLLTMQERLQKSIIESNKLLQPYLDMEQYPAFDTITVEAPIDDNVLQLNSSKRNLLRDAASNILEELDKLNESSEDIVEATVIEAD